MNCLCRLNPSRLVAQKLVKSPPKRNGNVSTFYRRIGNSYSTAAASQLKPTNEEPILVSTPAGQLKNYDPKLVRIVGEISGLTLLEVSDLNELLKKTLNIPDAPLMGPMMMGSFAPAAPAQEEEEAAAPAQVQTSFTLKLVKYDDTKKVALIKEVKNLLEGMNLVQSKKFVESTPTVVKADISKEEAEKLKAAFEAVGATLEIV